MLIRRTIISSFALLNLAACKTFETPGTSLTFVTSEPAGALVTIEGFGECETPCSFEHDALRMLTVAKAGYVTQSFSVKPGAREVNVILKLAAPTEGVEEEQLPEL